MFLRKLPSQHGEVSLKSHVFSSSKTVTNFKITEKTMYFYDYIAELQLNSIKQIFCF